MILIGEASRLSGASIKAIRHYDELGLLPNLGRAGTYRTFTKRDIDTIRLIKEAQNIGFKLSEFRDAFVSDDNSSWVQIENLIRIKELEVKKEIRLLKEKQARLKKYSKIISDCLKENPLCSEPLSIEQFD